MNPKTFLLSALLIVPGIAAFAQTGERTAAFIQSRFSQLDADHDGKLSAAEAKSVAALLVGADENGDGALTLDEVLAHLKKQTAKVAGATAQRGIAGLAGSDLEGRFRQLDQNGDGKLTDGELAQARWLAKLDEDRDGAVSLAEVKAFFATVSAPAVKPPTGPVPPPLEEKDSPREQPRLLKATEHGVGAMVADLDLPLPDGGTQRLSAVAGDARALVIALVSPSCPVSKRYLPTLAALVEQIAERGVKLLLVVPPASETVEELAKGLADAGLKAQWVNDKSGAISRALGATATTDCFVLDARRTLVYRGAIDDQYGLGYSLDAPRHRYLAEAIDAALAGRVPAVLATAAPGCALDLTAAPAPTASAVTFHSRISRILQANCLECHRNGGVAPFALETPEQVLAKAGMIRKMVDRGLMPPWFAAPPAAGAHNPWANDRSLPERDRADLLAWIDGGKPLGDSADAPLPRQWDGEWRIGKPDMVVQIPSAIEIKATGTMPYQNVVVETGLTEDKWVSALEVKPTAREVVHHVLVFVRGAGSGALSRADREEEGGPGGGFFAAYVPGNDHVIYAEGMAKPLPAGSRLHFQIHYTPNGTVTRDQVRIGLRFAATAPEHIVRVAGIANPRLSIPAGAENHPESALIPIPRDVKLLAFTPHMHVRGKSFRYDLIQADGSERSLLHIPRYDFNWQLSYRYAEPPTIPAGSKVRATGWFDNSANNPANPDPKKTVRWGQQTTDEMMIGYVEYFVPGEKPQIAGSR